MISRNRVGFALLSLLAIVLGFYVYGILGIRMGGNPSSLRSPFRSEEEWIVDQIVRDIAEMAANGSEVPPSSVAIRYELLPEKPLPSVRLKAEVGSFATYEGTLSLAGSFWNPESYSALASKLLGPGTGGRNEIPGSSLPERLLEARASVLATESARVSTVLAADIRDASAHEEAALVLAAFALREAAFRFQDIRFLLGRMTAHLAVARALRGGEASGPAGAIAEAALLTLSGRENEALAAIERLQDAGSNAATCWRNALYMYSSGDWRGGSGADDSLLERVQRFRAMLASLGSTAAVARFQDSMDGELADWGRIVTWGYSGAASDSGFVTSQMGRELAELQEVWRLEHGRPLSPGYLADELNVPAGRLLGDDGPRVLGWGTWAASYQRHICGLLAAAEDLLHESLGTPDGASEFRHQADQVFSGLTLSPIVQVRRTRKAGHRVEETAGMDESIALARRSPELVNATNWLFLVDTASHMMRKRGMPRAESWFSRTVLETSVFDTRPRVQLLKPEIGDGEEVMSALHAIAPTHPMVVGLAVDRIPRAERTVERVRAELGDRTEFDLGSLRQLRDAAGDDPEKRAPTLARMCELDANECFDLGWDLARLGRSEKAARAFERGVDEAPDSIVVCNTASWLVNYYYDGGRVGQANALAERMADVYCAWGLYTRAYLSERMGRPSEAERWYQAQAERYDEKGGGFYPLLGFYYRMARARKAKDYEPAFEELLSNVFPSGLEPLPSAFDDAPPTDGLLIDGDNERLRAAGLRGADVIVGLDGFRVHSLEQYDAVRNFQALPSSAMDMHLRIWRQTQYLDIDAKVFGRYLWVYVRTYGTPGPSVQYR